MTRLAVPIAPCMGRARLRRAVRTADVFVGRSARVLAGTLSRDTLPLAQLGGVSQPSDPAARRRRAHEDVGGPADEDVGGPALRVTQALVLRDPP
ncbi:MAG TPA: hypothetical protein VEK57_02310 [Thermoanaerobaculia bacterium]|nr:hypothetical protein [Thermoanaerobaculia bacterium]